MTREVLGSAPAAPPLAEKGIDFDLGELERAGPQQRRPERVPVTQRLRAWRARTWRVRSWRGLAVAIALAVVAGFAGWHVGVQHSRDQSEALISAHPPVIAWLVDNGLDPSSSTADAREDLELHVLNVGPDPVRVDWLTAGSSGSGFSVRPSSEVPSRLKTGEAAISSMVLSADCTTDHKGPTIAVGLTRFDAKGKERRATVTAGGDVTVGSSLTEILSRLCDNPASFGLADIDVKQTSGTSGATLTVTNTSSTLRQVEITSDESPAFELVQASPGPQLLQPGQTRDLRVTIRVLKCNAIVGLQDWASTISLQVVHRGESLDASSGAGIDEAYPIPDLVLVPGGAAIQRACNP